MFRQEIMNVEKQKMNFCINIIYSWFCHKPPTNLDYKTFNTNTKKNKNKNKNSYLDPEKMNHFITKLMDPFKNEEETREHYIHNLETLWFTSNEPEWIIQNNNNNNNNFTMV
jgi:hypothetical protein